VVPSFALRALRALIATADTTSQNQQVTNLQNGCCTNVSANKGDTVIGDFSTYGSIKIFNASGTDVSGYIYIEDYGLSKSRLQDKWNDKYRAKCE
jgi:hypothetical protein